MRVQALLAANAYSESYVFLNRFGLYESALEYSFKHVAVIETMFGVLHPRFDQIQPARFASDCVFACCL